MKTRVVFQEDSVTKYSYYENEDGVDTLHGVFKITYSNGGFVLKSYKNGYLHGLNKIYQSDNCFWQCNYHEGLRQGESIYTKEGTLIRSTMYKDDRQHGKHTKLIKNMLIQEEYDNGLLILRTIFVDGVMTKQAQMNGEIEHGTYTEYYLDGKIYITRTYKNGKIVGETTSFYNTGGIRSKETYNDKGDAHGISVLYHSNGNVMAIQEYRNGYQVGLDLVFDDKGEITYHGNFDSAGELHGEIILTYPNDNTDDNNQSKFYVNGTIRDDIKELSDVDKTVLLIKYPDFVFFDEWKIRVLLDKLTHP